MPHYESEDFRLAAPVVRATVQGPTDVVVHDVRLLIDSGAEVSVVPLAVASAVGAVVRPSRLSIQFFTGIEASLQEADLTIEILHRRFRGTFLVAEASHGIVGRNILNRLVLTLDGPNQSWSLSE
jgi:hypothetical protein